METLTDISNNTLTSSFGPNHGSKAREEYLKWTEDEENGFGEYISVISDVLSANRENEIDIIIRIPYQPDYKIHVDGRKVIAIISPEMHDLNEIDEKVRKEFVNIEIINTGYGNKTGWSRFHGFLTIAYNDQWLIHHYGPWTFQQTRLMQSGRIFKPSSMIDGS